jgi:sterol desaturase/sphingolipid hydroxylase (fatty acid hydroxylase superfamily)
MKMAGSALPNLRIFFWPQKIILDILFLNDYIPISSFEKDMVLDFLLGKGGLVFGALITLLLLERIFPVVTLRENFARLGRNFSLTTLNVVLSPVLVIPLTQLASAWTLPWRPESLVVDLLLLDCWIYIWHRMNHVIPFLWRFHEVHHLDETLDASSGLRFHFGEVLLSAMARALVMIVLAIPLRHVVIFEVLLALAALFHHSNIRLPGWLERPLSYLIVTPSIHWVHHHAVRRDTDSNYSTVLSIWDRIFGSRSPTARDPTMKIGVEHQVDVPLVRLILRPFYRP